MLKKIGYFFVVLIISLIAYFQYSTYQDTMVSEYFLGCKNDDIGDIFTGIKTPENTSKDKFLSYLEMFKARGNENRKKITYHYDSLKKSFDLKQAFSEDESVYMFSNYEYKLKIDRENLLVSITSNSYVDEGKAIRNLECEKIDKSVFLEEKRKVTSKYNI